MPAPDQEYRSLMLRKAQLLAQQHGGISNIPRELQTKLGFDLIAGRKGSLSISVRIPEGDLSSRISELKSELPKITFESAKPDPEKIFGKYVPQVSLENQTMEDFWIMQGWYKEGRGKIKLTKAKWGDDEKTQIDAVRFLVQNVLKKDLRDITAYDFSSNGLSGLLSKKFANSPYEALVKAGLAYSAEDALRHAKGLSFCNDKPYPWEMLNTPRNFYASAENRIAATKWLIGKLRKDPWDIVGEDFSSNRLTGPLAGYYTNSPLAALVEAGYAYSLEESLQHSAEGNFQNGRIYPWEMVKTPDHFYDSAEDRIAATKWLVARLNKSPREIIANDFYLNGLSGLMCHHKGSPYEALLEAGLVTPADEAYMRSHYHAQHME